MLCAELSETQLTAGAVLNIGKSVEQLLAENQVLSFDLPMVKRVCEMRSIPLNMVGSGGNPTLASFLETLTASQAQEFLVYYVVLYNAAKDQELAHQFTRNFSY